MKITWFIVLTITAGVTYQLECEPSEEVDGIPENVDYHDAELLKNLTYKECIEECCKNDNCTIAGVHDSFCILTKCSSGSNCNNHSFTPPANNSVAKFTFLIKRTENGSSTDDDLAGSTDNGGTNNGDPGKGSTGNGDPGKGGTDDGDTGKGSTDNGGTGKGDTEEDDTEKDINAHMAPESSVAQGTSIITPHPRNADDTVDKNTSCDLKCGSNAYCTLGLNNVPTCLCENKAKVYVDDECVEKTVCKKKSCPAYSTCSVKSNKIDCTCIDGYKLSDKNTCEQIMCSNVTCPLHSTCSIKKNSVHCYCSKGYKALQGFCREDKPCTVDPENKGCPDNEQCRQVSTKSLKCFCVPGKKRDDTTGDCTDEAPSIQLTTKNVTITLPEDQATLSVIVVPTHVDDEEYYTFKWSVKSAPKDSSTDAKMSGMTKSKVEITDLLEGEYVFNVDVIGKVNEFKSKVVSVTVLPKPHKNNPPIAVIKPSGDLSFKLPAEFSLNAIDSDDDDKIVSYKWTIDEQPTKAKTQLSGETTDTLHVKVTEGKGKFVFKVVVTDSHDLEGIASKAVEILAEDDFPPSAKVSAPQVLTLPENKVTLYGNETKDDHGIVKYQWEKSDDSPKAGDMLGTTTPVLKLANLVEGTYTFTLAVWDKKSQNSSAKTTVTIRPAQTGPPKANAGDNKELIEPDSSTMLDGSGSVSPLGALTHYHWEQVSGPNDVVIKDANESKALVTGLERGSYQFKLTVTDKKNVTSTDKVTVAVKKDNNKPPNAVVSNDLTIYLPNTAVDIDGSTSTDDDGIVRWKWTRSNLSPAIGNIVNKSDSQPVLKLCDLTIGLYTFTLTVYDKKNLTDSASVSIKVEDDPHAADIIEVYLFDDPAKFTHQRLQNLKKVLMVPISSSPSMEGDIDLKVLSVKVINEKIVVYFYGVNITTGVIVEGNPIVKILREMIFGKMLKFNFDVIDTATCSNTCNDHGKCETKTRTCVCDDFWMENFFKASAGRQFSNCEWSKIYFGIILTLILVIFICVLYIVYYVIQLRNRELLKRKRYKLLEEETGRGITLQDSSDEEYLRLKKRKSTVIGNNSHPNDAIANFKAK